MASVLENLETTVVSVFQPALRVATRIAVPAGQAGGSLPASGFATIGTFTFTGSLFVCIMKAATDAALKNNGIIDSYFDLRTLTEVVSSGCRIPIPERRGAVPAPFDPEETVTSPDGGWRFDPGGDWDRPCPPGSRRDHEKLHFDDGISTGEGRHWDYTDCDGNTWKIWPDGTMTPA
jgi:hypothetical protein